MINSLERIRHLHQEVQANPPITFRVCNECRTRWPCDVALVLERLAQLESLIANKEPDLYVAGRYRELRDRIIKAAQDDDFNTVWLDFLLGDDTAAGMTIVPDPNPDLLSDALRDAGELRAEVVRLRAGLETVRDELMAGDTTRAHVTCHALLAVPSSEPPTRYETEEGVGIWISGAVPSTEQETQE